MVAKLVQVSAAAKLFEAERQHLIAIVGDDTVRNFVSAFGERIVARTQHRTAEPVVEIDRDVDREDGARVARPRPVELGEETLVVTV